MHTELVQVPRYEAHKLWRQYQSHLAYSEPIDWEIQRAYYLLSKGKVIIRAIESIKNAGLNREFLPKLAISPAHAKECFLTRHDDGACSMSPHERWSNVKRYTMYFPTNSFVFPKESFPLIWRSTDHASRSEHKATVPIIPIHLRPKRGLANYSILWEAEWQRLPPRDPYLLRRIGKADLWLVVAHWELTPVEMAALATRV